LVLGRGLTAAPGLGRKQERTRSGARARQRPGVFIALNLSVVGTGRSIRPRVRPSLGAWWPHTLSATGSAHAVDLVPPLRASLPRRSERSLRSVCVGPPCFRPWVLRVSAQLRCGSLTGRADPAPRRLFVLRHLPRSDHRYGRDPGRPHHEDSRRRIARPHQPETRACEVQRARSLSPHPTRVDSAWPRGALPTLPAPRTSSRFRSRFLFDLAWRPGGIGFVTTGTAAPPPNGRSSQPHGRRPRRTTRHRRRCAPRATSQGRAPGKQATLSLWTGSPLIP
jgi:hypothetical protein